MKKIYYLFFILSANLFSQADYEILFLNKNYDEIILKSQKKETAEDFYWHALILDKENETLKAIDILKKGIESYNNQKLQRLIAQLYYETGNYKQALPYLEDFQESPEHFIQLINILEFQNDNHKAIELLINKLENDSTNLKYLIHTGYNYYQVDDIRSSLKYYLKAFCLNHDDQNTAKKIATIYLKIKKYYESIALCDTILKSDSTNKAFIAIKGMGCFNIKDFNRSEKCFNYLYVNGDTSNYTLKHLGISLYHNRKFNASRPVLLKAYQLDSEDYETCFFLGRDYLNSPEPEKALFYYNRVDSLMQPDAKILSTLYYEKQSVYSAINKHNEALNSILKAYKYTPSPEYLFYAASIYQHKLNNNKKAYEYYNRFINSLPPKPHSENSFEENQITISLRATAEKCIAQLKETLFFEGELEK